LRLSFEAGGKITEGSYAYPELIPFENQEKQNSMIDPVRAQRAFWEVFLAEQNITFIMLFTTGGCNKYFS